MRLKGEKGIRNSSDYDAVLRIVVSGRRELREMAAIRHFSVLDDHNIKKGTGGLICLSQTSLPLTGDSITIPVRAL